MRYDALIIGGGIVGLATADRLLHTRPDTRLAILEKEPLLASHQTGRNSGVLHSGIYYRPGSLKARNCRAGKAAMEAFCRAESIPFDTCGKVIVATAADELPALDTLYARGQANGVDCRRIEAAELAEIEPHAAGIRAIHVPETGIVDYRAVAERLASRIIAAGGVIRRQTEVLGIDERADGVTVETSRGAFHARTVVNCSGVYVDRLARRAGAAPPAQIVPFRGEYYALTASAEHLCRGLIYPVPNPRFPFLGVHFTRLIGGGVECGPNAVLAFGREAYRFHQIAWRDLLETVRYPGFRRLARAYWRTGSGEMWRSLSKPAFVRALRRLVPAIRADQLVPRPAGIRAQALLPDGALMDDFAFQDTARVVNVINAPSPAATAAFPIGAAVAERVAQRL